VGFVLPGPGLGLQQFAQGIWKPIITPDLNTSTLQVSALLLDRENALWIGTTDQGIYRVHDGSVSRFGSVDGLSSNSVTGFYEDREGNLWVTTSGGIDCFRDSRMVSFSIREGLSANRVSSVLASHDGTIWVGNGGALDSLRNGSVSSIREGKGLPGNRVTALLEDHAGRLWVGLDSGLFVYEENKFRAIRRRDGTPIGVVIAMVEDRDHNIWAEAIGNPARLLRIQDFEIREDFAAPQTPAAASLAADPEDGIWLGLVDGALARYRHGQLEIIPATESQNSVVRQVLVNSDGSVVGATSAGLIAWQHGMLRTLTVHDGLPCELLYGLVSDDKGYLWIYAQCGLVKISLTELREWWKHPDHAVNAHIYDVFDGVQPSGASFQPRASRSPDGRLWFANESVLQMIDPAHLAENLIPPPVHIEEVVADRRSYAPGQGLRLPRLLRDLEIEYAALSFVAPQKVRVRYKLEGRDAGWQEPGTRRQAFYSDLPPGRYRFRVIASNNDGLWNEEGATLDFSIAPAWFQTFWFRLACIVIGALVVWAIYRLRVRQVAKVISARFDERLAERTRMARDLHDTFLQTIQGSKLVADDALDPSTDFVRMRHAMEQLSVWLEQAMREGRAALNSLRSSTTQKNDLAEAFRRATENGLMPGSMQTTFCVVGEAGEMHPIVRDEVYRIGYEAICNAYKHSQASRIDIELRYAQDLALRVRDNGVGIDPSTAALGKDGHFGLRGMRERAARIGGKLTLVSSANSGTEIAVVIPGSVVFQKESPTPFEKMKTLLRRMVRKPNPGRPAR
jgi:signal transduction histidine kinase/streptogramin lyase